MQTNIPFNASWRTSLGGLATLLAGLSSAAHLLHQGNYNFGDPLWTAVIANVGAGIGLLHARDNKVSSEQVGLNNPPPEKPTVITDAFKQKDPNEKPTS